MNCFLGIDGGGSKTDCVVLSEAGAIIVRAKGPASNPTRIGFPAAFAALKETFEAALNSSQMKLNVRAACAGLAGTGNVENRQAMQQFLAQHFPGALVEVRTDMELVLSAMLDGPAIVLIVGTGSVAIGRDLAGSILREGGLGPATSDEGSGFDIGRSAVAAVREEKSAGPAGQLARQILQQLGAADWAEVDRRCADNADSVYPRIFPVAAAAADDGNSVAQSVLNTAAEKLAAISYNLAQSLNLAQEPFTLGKTGGTIGRSRFFDRAIDRELRLRLPNAAITVLKVEPAEVAAWLALQHFTDRAGVAP
jgi:N-acetylglucosamine kinase